MKILASAMVLFGSIVITCEAVGKTHGRRAISDRDMRSERPEFERCAPLCHMALVPKKKGQIENLLITPDCPVASSNLKPQTHNRLCG